MIICKQPSIGAKVPIHTDSTFLYTHPSSAIGFWIALEDVTLSNGALSFLPGSHLDPRSRVGERFVRLDQGTGFVSWDDEKGEERVGEKIEKVDWENEEGWVKAPCKAGSLVLIHGTSSPFHHLLPN
jgi:phytanoyl-CoA hydroxylase